MKLSNKQKIAKVKEILDTERTTWNYSYKKAYKKIRSIVENGK